MPLDLILGTAGHIDHGKTSLIRGLTGIDTDRLPEEKQRGITIELGFAQLMLDDIRLGIVDVPGHERFVRNMLAGATGMDLALLVVAADDSVKPQTREHLEILRLLDLPAGVVALTKCDIADPDWIDLVEAEVRDLIEGTFLESAPIVRTSAETGEGLGELRQALASAAGQAAGPAQRRQSTGPFRMAIDRTFTIAGHGTVVTGSVASGKARVGDTLCVEPGGVEVRVRGLQQHEDSVEEVHRGQRAAINLAGVHHEEIRRGQELTTPGHLRPSRLVAVRIDLLPSTPRPLKQRARVRLHLGTAEVLATTQLLEVDRLEPGESAVAQLFLAEPVVATWSQPLVLRSESPVATIGGGVILDPVARKIRPREQERIDQLSKMATDDRLQRASAALYLSGLEEWQPRDLARSAGIEDFEAVAAELADRGELIEIALSTSRKLRVHRQTLSDLARRVVRVMEKFHHENPLLRMADRGWLTQQFDYLPGPAVLETVLAQMVTAKEINDLGRGVALAGHGPQLSKNEQRLIEHLIEQYRHAGVQPPTVKELQQQTSRNQASVPQLIQLAASEGTLVQINPQFYLHQDVAADVRQKLQAGFARGGLTMSEIRELLGTSRKYAVPICEYLDKTGFTQRQGDVRVLAEAAASH